MSSSTPKRNKWIPGHSLDGDPNSLVPVYDMPECSGPLVEIAYAWTEEHARLLSAAPELLGVVERLEDVVDDLMGEISGEGPVQDWQAVNDLLVDASAALAKVAGEPHPEAENE